jgi:hypothetical protein
MEGTTAPDALTTASGVGEVPALLRSAAAAGTLLCAALLAFLLARPTAAASYRADHGPAISVRDTGTPSARGAGAHVSLAGDRTIGTRARLLTAIGGSRAGGANVDRSAGAGSPAYIGVAVIGFGALGVVLLVGGGLLLRAARRRQVSA